MGELFSRDSSIQEDTFNKASIVPILPYSNTNEKIMNEIAKEKVEDELREKNEFITFIIENISDLICLHKPNGDYIYISPSVKRILGYYPEELMEKNIYDYIHPDDIESMKREHCDKILNRKLYEKFEYRIRKESGTYIWFETIFAPYIDENGNIVKLQSCSRDISERKCIEQSLAEKNKQKLVEKALRISEEKFTKLFQMNPLPMALTHMENGQIVEVNKAFIERFAPDDNSIIGRTTSEINMFLDYKLRDKLVNKLKKGETIRDFEIQVRYKNGQVGIVSMNVETVEIYNNLYLLSVLMDITERKNNEKIIFYNAYHDALTAVPNRCHLEQKLNLALKQAKNKKEMVAILFIDLDGFKHINDTLGHKAGDDLLKVIATRFKSILREGDTVARFGGDEFIIILRNIDKKESLEKVAERINYICRIPVNIKNKQISVSSSIGISLFPNDGEDIESLIKTADAAMYKAKGLGKDKYCFYN